MVEKGLCPVVSDHMPGVLIGAIPVPVVLLSLEEWRVLQGTVCRRWKTIQNEK